MTSELIKLNSGTLSNLHENVKVPLYNRSIVKSGIVHVGIGGFHRSHQAFYTDLLLGEHGANDWGICGVALLKWDKRIFDTLVAQDGLYTLLITSPDGTTTASVIGSIVEYLYAPDSPEAVIEKMAHPDIKIITSTITEGGYNMNPSTGEFQLDNEAIIKDIANPTSPETIFGYLAEAFRRRRDRGLKGLTVQSCDNIQQNGDVTKKMVLAYINAADASLSEWVAANVSFPNAMVDRITPVTTPADIDLLKQQFGIDDAWPVVCEPFHQWVIEDHFIAGRPDWNLVGAQFVRDVHPYEKMKIRLLNGSHSALAMTSILTSHQYVYESMADPLFIQFVRGFMTTEVLPILDAVPGIDLPEYCNTLLERFANPNIKDQLTRIVSETSAKAPKFLVATITDQLELAKKNSIDMNTAVKGLKHAIIVLASWCRYVELSVSTEDTPGYPLQDAMKDTLVAFAVESQQEGKVDNFLKNSAIFGDLSENVDIVALYSQVLQDIRTHGIVHVITNMDEY